MSSKHLVFVTGNAEKLREVREILADGAPLELESRAIDLPEIQGSTQEVAIAKCQRAAEIVGGPCITEDTALCFEALNGLPGPYIKFFLKGLGHEGLNKMLDGFETRNAWALCTFGFCEGPGAEPIVFEGRTDGQIVRPRGPPKFGWDPVFEPLEGGGKTYAELDPVVKNKISHRYRALAKLREFLHNRENTKN